jgi:hypothetical protein
MAPHPPARADEAIRGHHRLDRGVPARPPHAGLEV